MTTERNLNLLFSYQKKIREQADNLISGKPVSPGLVTDLALKVREVRLILK